MLEEGDKRKECCQKADNLVPHQGRPDLTVNVCKVCGCRHFELVIDPGQFGLMGAGMGG